MGEQWWCKIEIKSFCHGGGDDSEGDDGVADDSGSDGDGGDGGEGDDGGGGEGGDGGEGDYNGGDDAEGDDSGSNGDGGEGDDDGNEGDDGEGDGVGSDDGEGDDGGGRGDDDVVTAVEVVEGCNDGGGGGCSVGGKKVWNKKSAYRNAATGVLKKHLISSLVIHALKYLLLCHINLGFWNVLLHWLNCIIYRLYVSPTVISWSLNIRCCFVVVVEEERQRCSPSLFCVIKLHSMMQTTD